MSGYTKLFASILDSTVWLTDPNVRLVWITMLAMADQDGRVEASVPGLAIRARVSRAECEDAISVLSSPDPDSRSPEAEGRRIVKIDGGWELVNHAKYRQRMDAEERRERDAERKRRKRASMSADASANVRACPPVSSDVPNVSHADADADADSDQSESSERARTNEPRDFVGVRPKATPVIGPWASALFNAYHAHWRSRGLPSPDSDARRPEHPMWKTLAEYMHERSRLRGWLDDLETRAAKSTALIQNFYATSDARTVQAGHPLSFLVSRPGNYTGDRRVA